MIDEFELEEITGIERNSGESFSEYLVRVGQYADLSDSFLSRLKGIIDKHEYSKGDTITETDLENVQRYREEIESTDIFPIRDASTIGEESSPDANITHQESVVSNQSIVQEEFDSASPNVLHSIQNGRFRRPIWGRIQFIHENLTKNQIRFVYALLIIVALVPFAIVGTSPASVDHTESGTISQNGSVTFFSVQGAKLGLALVSMLLTRRPNQ